MVYPYIFIYRDVMQRQMATIHVRPKVGDVVLLLQTVEHGAFPVVASSEIATTPYIAEYARSSKSSDGPSVQNEQGSISNNNNNNNHTIHPENNDWRQQIRRQPARGVIGIISRHILLQLLKTRHYSLSEDSPSTMTATPHSQLQWLPLSQLDEAWPNITDKDAEREILEHYLGGVPSSVLHSTLDLEPYMNPNPFIVSEWSTAADVSILFFTQGNHD